jgi:hypothetical protein
MNKHVPIEAPLLIHYIETLFREGHCLVTALLLLKNRPEDSRWDVVEYPTATSDGLCPDHAGPRVNTELTSR